MHFHLLFIIFFTFLTVAFSFSITTHNKTIAFEGQTLPYFETPATVIDSKEDEDSNESDDFRPHEEDDDLNRGAINIRPGNKELIDSVPSLKKGSIDEDRGRPDDSISFISKAFTSRKTFSCPKTKTDFVTGNNLAMLNPEDIRIIAAMGDTVATGAGLWPLASIEFRGAAFPIGGDASIDGLVTIPNILREFIERQLLGVSHGMGSRDELPHYQLNVAESGAKTKDLPSQAEELVRRLNKMKEYNIRDKWVMIIFTIGTEELCDHCAVPHLPAIKDALDILNRGIHKAFVVIVGPLHVSLASQQTKNLLQDKCNCTKTKTDNYVHQLFDAW
uniref:Lipase_GDSL domain-containing protein n=1 Tax=Panagrolaimus sp. PS1159 TaxID=55785 RepID=A0AC35ERB2_9BILA